MIRCRRRRRRVACDVGIRLHERGEVWLGHCYTHDTDFVASSGCPR